MQFVSLLSGPIPESLRLKISSASQKFPLPPVTVEHSKIQSVSHRNDVSVVGEMRSESLMLKTPPRVLSTVPSFHFHGVVSKSISRHVRLLVHDRH